MSQQELAAQKVIVELVKLYLKESPNEFTMDEPVFNKVHAYTHRAVTGSFAYYPKGYVLLKDQYSPLKVKLSFYEVYKWGVWRQQKLLLARELYANKDENFDISSMECPPDTLKKILKTIK